MDSGFPHSATSYLVISADVANVYSRQHSWYGLKEIAVSFALEIVEYNVVELELRVWTYVLLSDILGTTKEVCYWDLKFRHVLSS
jgi:hypothetical protein